MNKLKKERSIARQLFTRAKNNFNEACNSDDRNRIKIYFKYLTEKAENLFGVDQRIKEQWFLEDNENEMEFLEDCETVDTYKIDWIELESRYENIFQQVQNPESKYDSASVISTNNKRALRLPKLELTKFDGNAKNWLGFWSSFKKIHNDPTIDDDDKMAYLVQSMTANSGAQELVKSFPPCGENYNQAVEQLKSRYARDELLIEIYVRELLALVLQQAKQSNSINISSLYDKLKTQLRALEVLGVTSEKYAAMLYPLVESALPEEMLRVWERQRTRDNGTDVLNNLLEFIRIEVESEERIQITRQGLSTVRDEGEKFPTASCLVAGNNAKPAISSYSTNVPQLQCIWCDKTSHGSHECYKAQKLSLEGRKEIVAKKKACNVCLKIGHHGRKCKSFTKCIICQKRHAIFLCPEIIKPCHSTTTDNSELTQQSTDNNVSLPTSSITLLQTLLVKVGGDTVRAFIDTGAQRSYIRDDIARKLHLKSEGQEVLRHHLFGGVETKEESHQLFCLTVRSLSGEFSFNMSALNKEKICGYIPRVRSDTSIIKKLKENNICILDIGDNTPEIGLLIGADYAGKIMTGTVKHLNHDLYAIQTKLGWTIQGIVKNRNNSVIANVDLSNDISQLWKLEVLGIEEPKEHALRKRTEKEALEDFNRNIIINEEQRYEVRLPWKIGRPELFENRQLSEKRLLSTTKRLKFLGEVENYGKIFEEWLNLGIIELDPDKKSLGHYLPHHAVIKESSSTTRVRPVFDASARDSNGNSINSCLEKGQNFLELIVTLTTRFRMHAVGITSDIKKAFLQISISEEDRRYLRFLWWSKTGDIIVYRHRRVVFGLTCSPFLLAATLIYHLEKYATSERAKSATLLRDSFYVDNCVTSLNSQEEAEHFIEEAKDLMKEGKFELRGWITAPMRCVNTEKQSTVSLLGMIWNTDSDILKCNLNAVKTCKDRVTKRELLSICNRIFDPIGLTSPTTLIPKLLLQRTWCLNLSWDADLPAEINQEFKKWMDDIHWLHECSIPRRLTVKPIGRTKNSLHVFSDASRHAYATSIFLRSEAEDNEVSVQLVLAKSRVTPVKEISIPRLELIAAVMATRSYLLVSDALRLENCRTYFWSDSSVAVTWIVTDREWNIFVKNRVREIRENSRREDWRHIVGSLNPADLPSRGCNAKKLVESKWWEGPAWLKESEDKWPVSIEIVAKEEDVNKELRKTVIINADTIPENFTNVFNKISKFSKLLRTIAWMLRFCYNCRTNTKIKGDITQEESEKATIVLYRLVQEESFRDKKNVRGMKNIETIEDDRGLIRVKTRLTMMDEDENFKFPILLNGKHSVVTRLVEQKHILHLHAGLHALTSILRNDFWITGCKKLVRNIISRCIVCKRYKVRSYQTCTAPLPKNRIKDAAVFQVTGIDAAGPLILNTGDKCWIILFTCAIYRAIHLELVMSMSTECFLQALRRFIARRGRTQTIYSDNGSNFVGAENQLSNINWDHVMEYSTAHKIKWIFNPPAAPWWGGWWERLIQMIKQLLRRNLGRSILTFIELETLLCDIESIINARPLTYIAEGDTLLPLTPANFLHNLPGTEVPDLDTIDAQNLRIRHRYVQKLRSDLRQRFRDEYLSLLVSRSQNTNQEAQEGDVVIIETEAKRMNWPLGIITEIYAGKDNKVRVAKVKTSDGFRIRPIQRLYPLEMNTSKERESTCINLEPEVTPKVVPELRQEETPEAKSEMEKPRATRRGRIIKVPRRLDL